MVEILDPIDIPLYEDAGVDCLQIGEPNSKNQALLNRLRTTPLPVIHKRGNSLDTEAYLLWVERVMSLGKENVILCERGIATCNRYTRNTLDLGSVAAFHYQLSGLPVAVDASHGTGIRDLVHPMTLAGIMAGASVVLVEAHPNPLIAKSDGFQGLFRRAAHGTGTCVSTRSIACGWSWIAPMCPPRRWRSSTMLVWQPIGSAFSAARGLVLTGRRCDCAEFPLSAFARGSFERMTDGLKGILLSKHPSLS